MLEDLIREYVLYGLSREAAKECAEQEIASKEYYAKHGDVIVKQIDNNAHEYNKRQKELKKLAKKRKQAKQEQDQKTSLNGRKYNHAKAVVDPYGIVFKTTGEMCDTWGVLLPTYCNRLAKGWTMLEALMGKKQS